MPVYVQGKYEEQFERSDEFQQQLIIKVREILTEKEWRRRKMQMRVSRLFSHPTPQIPLFEKLSSMSYIHVYRTDIRGRRKT